MKTTTTFSRLHTVSVEYHSLCVPHSLKAEGLVAQCNMDLVNSPLNLTFLLSFRLRCWMPIRSCSVSRDSLWCYGLYNLTGSSVLGIFPQGYWSGLTFLPPGDLSNPGTEATSALHADSLALRHQGSPPTLKRMCDLWNPRYRELLGSSSVCLLSTHMRACKHTDTHSPELMFWAIVWTNHPEVQSVLWRPSF